MKQMACLSVYQETHVIQSYYDHFYGTFVQHARLSVQHFLKQCYYYGRTGAKDTDEMLCLTCPC